MLRRYIVHKPVSSRRLQAFGKTGTGVVGQGQAQKLLIS